MGGEWAWLKSSSVIFRAIFGRIFKLIDAVSSVADEECIVLLGRIARSMPALSDAALDTLESIDHYAAHLASIALRRTFDHPVLGEVYDE
jgi:hypothetical protein